MPQFQKENKHTLSWMYEIQPFKWLDEDHTYKVQDGRSFHGRGIPSLNPRAFSSTIFKMADNVPDFGFGVNVFMYHEYYFMITVSRNTEAKVIHERFMLIQIAIDE